LTKAFILFWLVLI